MSHLPDHLGHLNFYLTQPAPCPYIEGQIEQKLFTRLDTSADSSFFLNSAMNPHGFRRSQTMLYRPACPACIACVPVRIAVADFTPNRRLRRLERKNADLESFMLPVAECSPFFDLFSRYQKTRHGDSDMVNMKKGDFAAMMIEGGANSFLLALRDASHKTVAVMLADWLHHGTSAVYSYYDPAYEKRSLGTELILRLIAETREAGLDYVYLGYWIKHSRKMAYKSAFPALQRLGSDGWRMLGSPDSL